VEEIASIKKYDSFAFIDAISTYEHLLRGIKMKNVSKN
jgi:hypothetical protein